MLTDTAVFARWKDDIYYPAVVKHYNSTSCKYHILFNDGVFTDLSRKYFVHMEDISKGMKVYAQQKDRDCNY